MMTERRRKVVVDNRLKEIYSVEKEKVCSHYLSLHCISRFIGR